MLAFSVVTATPWLRPRLALRVHWERSAVTLAGRIICLILCLSFFPPPYVLPTSFLLKDLRLCVCRYLRHCWWGVGDGGYSESTKPQQSMCRLVLKDTPAGRLSADTEVWTSLIGLERLSQLQQSHSNHQIHYSCRFTFFPPPTHTLSLPRLYCVFSGL